MIYNKKDNTTLETYLEDIGGEGKEEDTRIAILERDNDKPTNCQRVYLTPDMVDEVCNQLQDWKKAFEE